MTQKQLADAVGLGQTAVASWESERNAPDGPMLLRLGVLLGVSFGATGMSADAAYALGAASGELRAIGEMAQEMARQAFAAADRVMRPRVLTPPSPLAVEAALDATKKRGGKKAQ